jgi:hypothetical protein
MRVKRGEARGSLGVYRVGAYFGNFESRRPGKGDGKAVMQAICQMADTLMLPITLQACACYSDLYGGDTLSQPALLKFYRRFGFRLIPNRYGPLGCKGSEMIRPAVLRLPYYPPPATEGAVQ